MLLSNRYHQRCGQTAEAEAERTGRHAAAWLMRCRFGDAQLIAAVVDEVVETVLAHDWLTAHALLDRSLGPGYDKTADKGLIEHWRFVQGILWRRAGFGELPERVEL